MKFFFTKKPTWNRFFFFNFGYNLFTENVWRESSFPFPPSVPFLCLGSLLGWHSTLYIKLLHILFPPNRPAICKNGKPKMASASSKTLIGMFERASKRLKPTLTPTSCKSDDATTNGSTLSVDQKSRIEYNKQLAKSKRNLKICLEIVSKHKGMYCNHNPTVKRTFHASFLIK